jgi:hypothetical protein
MRVGIISVFTDYHLLGRHSRGVLQPQAGPLIAGPAARGRGDRADQRRLG